MTNRNYKRQLDLASLLKKNSFFLLGPRGTGKSYWIQKSLPDAKVFNLLEDDLFESLMRRPQALGEAVSSSDKIIVIDEIQKLPKLLDEVHRLIESRKIRFLLTGSSARKLKRGGANLLAGRAWEANLFPLSYSEISDFDLSKYLNFGGLPRVYLSSEPKEELKSYVRLYLAEEIKAEALVRSYERFVKFLETIAHCNGQELNYSKIASDSGVPVRTLEGYVEVLEDTLIGYKLNPFQKTKKRKAVSKAKFYFFDLGVAHYLKGLELINPASTDWGGAFEHFIINEVRSYNAYTRKDEELCYWRTRDTEVDLIVGKRAAIEIKSSRKIDNRHFSGLKRLQEEKLISHYYLITACPTEGVHNGIQYLHYESFLKKLWGGKVF